MSGIRRTLVSLLVTAGLAVSVGLMTPASAGARGFAVTNATSPVGTWQGTVYHEGTSGSVTLSFHHDGRVCLRSGTSQSGGEGEGTWYGSSGNDFSYQVLERLYEDGGATTTGYVHVDQDATQQGGALESAGTSEVYSADHVYLTTVDATVTARRVSSTPAGC